MKLPVEVIPNMDLSAKFVSYASKKLEFKQPEKPSKRNTTWLAGSKYPFSHWAETQLQIVSFFHRTTRAIRNFTKSPASLWKIRSGWQHFIMIFDDWKHQYC